MQKEDISWRTSYFDLNAHLCTGVTMSAFGGSIGSVMVPEDGDFILSQALQPRSFLARQSKDLDTARLHVDKFDVSFETLIFPCKATAVLL